MYWKIDLKQVIGEVKERNKLHKTVKNIEEKASKALLENSKQEYQSALEEITYLCEQIK